MKHVCPAFNILKEGATTPPGSKFIHCHKNFEIKTDFTQKSHFVAGGHMADPRTSLNYSSVVVCDSIHLAFLIAASNDLDLVAADIGNGYLNAYIKEKVHMECGLEFDHKFFGISDSYHLKNDSVQNHWSIWVHTITDPNLTWCHTWMMILPAFINNSSVYYDSQWNRVIWIYNYLWH